LAGWAPGLRAGLEAASEGAHVARGLARALAVRALTNAVFPLLFPTLPKAPSPAAQAEIRRRLLALLRTDYRRARHGSYPEALVHRSPLRTIARAGPRLLLDLPRYRRRLRARRFDDLPADASYPKYYRRNFHWQSEGYLGEGSAAIYEAQVELLFGGLADAMRRQVLPPAVEAARLLGGAAKVLDLACGNGAVLELLGEALPDAQLYGVDLSPFYVAAARRRLGGGRRVSLLVENAEALPFVGGHFDVVTCVYLLHELPPAVRRSVLREIARVLRPGGTLVLADSLQLQDAPALAEVLAGFPEQFHEPFYAHYLRDDLEAAGREAGLELVTRESHFVTAVLTWRKPVAASSDRS
jgi:ubiquinone/menaquinone biosynthesis C-methylase UbiE